MLNKDLLRRDGLKKLNFLGSRQLLILSICIVLLISSSFALFYKNLDYTTQASSGGTSLLSSWSFTSSVQNGFSNPGDVCYGNLSIQNTSNTPITYTLNFSLSNNTGLENATLVYVDNVLVGNLGLLFSKGQNSYSLSSFTLNSNETISHQIKLEYHIGASSYYQAKNFSLTVNSYGKQIQNTDGITYVKSWYELAQIANQQALGGNSGEIIKLANNITPMPLDKDIIFNMPTTLDLNGKTLTLNKNISFKGAAISYLKSSKGTGQLLGLGRIYFDNSAGLLVSEQSYNSYVSITNFSYTLLQNTLNSYIKGKVKGGLTSNTNVLDGLILYQNYFSLTLNQSTISDGIVPIVRQNSTTLKQLILTVNTLSAISIEFQIIGNDDTSILNAILNGPLSYINSLTQFHYDLFLPTKIKEYNCQISWWSSNPNLLTNTGVYTKPVNNTALSLFATITFNGRTYIQEFNLVAEGSSNEEKLTYLCGQYGDILFSVVNQTENLPTASNYKNWTNNVDLGITNITYSFDSANTFLTLTNNSSLTINSQTTVTYVALTISATFSSGTPQTVSKIIDVTISLAGGTDVEPVYSYVQNSYPKNDASANFNMPITYSSLAIHYYLPDNIVGNKLSSDMINSTTEVVNSQDAVNIVSIVNNADNSTIVINQANIPTKTTLVYLIVEVVSGGSTSRRQMSFVVDGVLHGGTTFNASYQIPDPNLFSSLKTLVSVPSNRTYIAFNEISTATYSNLTLRTSAIQSIKGIEYFTKLTRLDLGGSASVYNTFSDISSIGSLINLTYIDLSYSNITDITPLKYCTATPSGGITLYLQYNANLKDNTPIANLYVGRANFTGTTCTYKLGAYTIFKVMKSVYGTISNTYNSYYSLSDTSSLIQTGSSKEVNAFPLADSFFLPEEIYDTLILPTSHTRTSSISYSWSVYTGMGSQYMTIANPTTAATVSITSRPVSDTKIVIVLDIAAANNLTNFSIPRAFFITLKGTG